MYLYVNKTFYYEECNINKHKIFNFIGGIR